MIHVKKIVVIGGESTGKSTLCEQLASIYKTAWVEEYARTYLENLNRPYVQDDLLVIAKGQFASEEYFIQDADRLLFVIPTCMSSRFGANLNMENLTPSFLR